VNMLVPFPGFPTPIPLRQGLWYATENYVPPYIGQWLGAPEAPLSSWDQLLMAYVNGTTAKPIFALANSDSHNTGDPNSTVGAGKNGVYVKKLTAQDFYKSLKAGRSFATTGPSLYLDVNGAVMGERAVIPSGKATLHLSVNSESTSAVLAKIDIYKNGEIWQTANPMASSAVLTLADEAVTGAGYYRVEVTAYDPVTGQYTFAWSNPVFVMAP
jgi:hypothetical protein